MTGKGTIDKRLLYVTLVLLAIGVIMVLSASSYEAMVVYKDAMYFFKRQIIWAIAGIIAMCIMMVIPVDWVKRVIVPATVIILVALVAVLLFGDVSRGAQRGFKIGSIQISPPEFAKPICIVMYAQVLTYMGKYTKTNKGFITAVGVLIVPVFLIVIEDLGTATCLAAALGCMLIVAGINFKHLAALIISGASFVAIFIAIEPYRVKRIFCRSYRFRLADSAVFVCLGQRRLVWCWFRQQPAKNALFAGEAYGLYFCDYRRRIRHYRRDDCGVIICLFFVSGFIDCPKLR